jgi:SAM-dependent methyltransferase
MDAKGHWEKVYMTKAPEAVSWYRPHLETSLALIERAAAARSASIVDVGGGESTLVDDLLLRGYKNIAVLDISQTAIDLTKSRLRSAVEQVRWLVGDITEIELEPRACDLWHDRAVFHFLTAQERRIAYVRQVAHSGHIIVSTFGPEGPTKCSSKELHHTPFGTTQQFLSTATAGSFIEVYYRCGVSPFSVVCKITPSRCGAFSKRP